MMWLFLVFAFLITLLLAAVVGNQFNQHQERMEAARVIARELQTLRYMLPRVDLNNHAMSMHPNNRETLFANTDSFTGAFLEKNDG